MRQVPKFHLRETLTYIAVLAWLPAGYDPTKPELVQVGIGQSTLWATPKQGLDLKPGYTVRVEAIGDVSMTLLVTDVLANTSPTPNVSTDDNDTQGDS